jgi:hypothetical protein
VAKPTIASLEAENADLRARVARVEDYLIDVQDAYYADKDEIIQDVAEILKIDVAQYQDVEWYITVRGKVKVSKKDDPNDLELTVNGQTVRCHQIGVVDHEYEDMEIAVSEVTLA